MNAIIGYAVMDDEGLVNDTIYTKAAAEWESDRRNTTRRKDGEPVDCRVVELRELTGGVTT